VSESPESVWNRMTFGQRALWSRQPRGRVMGRGPGNRESWTTQQVYYPPTNEWSKGVRPDDPANPPDGTTPSAYAASFADLESLGLMQIVFDPATTDNDAHVEKTDLGLSLDKWLEAKARA